jgi:hypothetical protein
MRIALLTLYLVISAGCGSKQAPSVVTVTKMPDAFRRLELLGYSHVKDTSVLGQEFVSYKRRGSDADFGAELVKWAGGDRIKQVIFSCYTDENGFKSDDSRLRFWEEMEQDFCSLFNASQDLSRAIDDLHEVKEGDLPVLRHEGRATTADGWQIQVIEQVNYYKPKYKKEEKHWVRVGVIWATHLESEENVPASALEAFDEQMREE